MDITERDLDSGQRFQKHVERLPSVTHESFDEIEELVKKVIYFRMK
jgi:hypothetical protein